MSDRYNGDDYRSPRGRPDVNRTIYVGNLRYDTEEKIVRDWFEKYYGPVSFVKLIYDKETGRSKGFCFVTFEEEADATEALNDSNGRWVISVLHSTRVFFLQLSYASFCILSLDLQLLEFHQPLDAECRYCTALNTSTDG